MKNIKITVLLFLVFNFTVYAQKQNRFNFSIGGGIQQYKGDLGNGFKDLNDATWYGNVILNTNYNLNKSFEFGFNYSKGDYGYCQSHKNMLETVDESLRCSGCKDRLTLGNLNSRITAYGVHFTYKFANNYLLKESAFIKPFVFLGASYNNVKDIMKMDCVTPGNYFAYNGGLGFNIAITKQIFLSYQLNFFYFNSDKIDKITSNKNDMMLQNTLMLGFSIF